MTVKELEEILKTIENKDAKVVDNYFEDVSGYFLKDDGTLVLSRYKVQPLTSVK